MNVNQAAASTQMATLQVQSKVQTGLLKQQMDDSASSAVSMIKDMMPATHPTLGKNVDLRA